MPPACFLEDGHLHRAVRIGAKLSVLEDLALFPEPQPVENMKLYQVSHRFWESGGETAELPEVWEMQHNPLFIHFL